MIVLHVFLGSSIELTDDGRQQPVDVNVSYCESTAGTCQYVI